VRLSCNLLTSPPTAFGHARLPWPPGKAQASLKQKAGATVAGAMDPPLQTSSSRQPCPPIVNLSRPLRVMAEPPRHANVICCPGAAVLRGEQVNWHQQYVRTAMELCQWDVIAEYAQQADDYRLQMDALWRLPNWDRLKRVVLPRAQVLRLFFHSVYLGWSSPFLSTSLPHPSACPCKIACPCNTLKTCRRSRMAHMVHM